MSMGNEIKELTAKVEEQAATISEQATAIEGFEAQVEAASQLDNDKIATAIDIAQAHEQKVSDLEEQLQQAQTDLAGALEINEELTSNLEDAEVDIDPNEAQAEIAELKAVVEAKDAKLESPAIKDASAEGEDEAADTESDSEQANVYEQYKAISDPVRAAEFWKENKPAILAAGTQMAKEKE